MKDYNSCVVIKKLSFIILFCFAFLQWNAIAHDFDHLAGSVINQSSQSQQEHEDLDHCDHCSVLKQLTHVFLEINSSLEVDNPKKDIFESYQLFAYTHFQNLKLIRGPPAFS